MRMSVTKGLKVIIELGFIPNFRVSKHNYKTLTYYSSILFDILKKFLFSIPLLPLILLFDM